MQYVKKLISASKIKRKVKKIGKQITKDYQGKQPVVICMLKGAVYFFSDLTKHIKLPIMIDFARLSSYRNGTTSGKMELIANFTTEITGKDVIIVEDIVDSGKTLAYFIELLKEKNPASIKICSFLDKTDCRKVPITVDYKCFDVPPVFVIGYGLDYAEKYRELPYLGAVLDPSKI